MGSSQFCIYVMDRIYVFAFANGMLLSIAKKKKKKIKKGFMSRKYSSLKMT